MMKQNTVRIGLGFQKKGSTFVWGQVAWPPSLDFHSKTCFESNQPTSSKKHTCGRMLKLSEKSEIRLKPIISKKKEANISKSKNG